MVRYYNLYIIQNFKIYNFEHIFYLLFFRGRAKYVREHTSALSFLHTNHNRSLPAKPIHTHLLYPILCTWKYSIRHKLLYCPRCIFGCFHGNQRCVASCHYFYTWEVLQEVDIICTVRPYTIEMMITISLTQYTYIIQ